jgi:hypothetical protein
MKTYVHFICNNIDRFRYPVYSSIKVTKWLEDNPSHSSLSMSVFDCWPKASGDLMPMDSVFSRQFDE